MLFRSLTEHAQLSRETVRRRLEENELKPWRQKMWCVPTIDAEYVARMEDVLDLYTQRRVTGRRGTVGRAHRLPSLSVDGA